MTDDLAVRILNAAADRAAAERRLRLLVAEARGRGWSLRRIAALSRLHRNTVARIQPEPPAPEVPEAPVADR